MNFTDKHLIDTYTDLLKGLSSSNKIELIENLSQLLKVEDETIERSFYNSSGAFSSTQSAEEIIADVKANRNFRNKEIEF
ncbi:MAG: hypothetical protein EOP43_05905 [Sphingobacteriaceae bacterium]|nr:MAG: hypothetical protein EOP43_05905 [Sphingobacteriaceae bacterium]